MAVVIETLDAAGNLVEVPQDPGGPSPSEPAAPPAEAPPGDSAPPVPPAAPPPEAPPGESAPPVVSPPEDSDTDTRDVPRGVQKRFDTLTRQREEARRENQAMQQRYDRELAELRGQLEMQTRLIKGEQPAAQVLPLHQQPAPSAVDYASDEEWLAARDSWQEARILHQVSQQQYQQAAMAEEQRQKQALAAREATVSAQHADYYAQIATLGDKGMTTIVHEALKQMELGPDLAYYLAQHPEDLQRLAPLPPLRVWLELGKLEARLAGNGTAPPQAPSVVTSSQPKPAPLTPVGSGGGGAPQIALDDPNTPIRAWEAEAERQYPGIFSRRR